MKHENRVRTWRAGYGGAAVVMMAEVPRSYRQNHPHSPLRTGQISPEITAMDSGDHQDVKDRFSQTISRARDVVVPHKQPLRRAAD